VNYEQLPIVYNNLTSRGFTILAFPCNQFGNQEPDANSVIQQFALSKNATFPFFAKSNVNAPFCTGPSTQCLPDSTLCCPSNNGVYEYLHSLFPQPADWNFHKYLVNRQGVPVAEYASYQDPLTLVPDILAIL
jgi:glutathione peroxidase